MTTPDDTQPALDLDQVAEYWLRQCGSCDAGIPACCTHPDEDYRPVMLRLVDEAKLLRAAVSTLSAENDRLGDELAEERNLHAVTREELAEVRAERAADVAALDAKVRALLPVVEAAWQLARVLDHDPAAYPDRDALDEAHDVLTAAVDLWEESRGA